MREQNFGGEKLILFLEVCLCGFRPWIWLEKLVRSNHPSYIPIPLSHYHYIYIYNKYNNIRQLNDVKSHTTYISIKNLV